MKVKTETLSGAALDWAVALCEGHIPKPWHTYRSLGTPRQEVVNRGVTIGHRDEFGQIGYDPSMDWSIAGPILEREGIYLSQFDDYPLWTARMPSSHVCHTSEHATEAAMRAYVYSKMGEEVDVPEELLK